MSQKPKRLKIPFDPSILKVAMPKAEVLVRIELQKRGLAKYLLPLNSVIIFHVEAVRIYSDTEVTRTMIQKVKEKERVRVAFTKPDLFWDMGADVKQWPVYLDGPVHKRRGVKNRDDAIDTELREMGFEPTRYPYTAASKKWIQEICDEMEAKVRMAHKEVPNVA